MNLSCGSKFVFCLAALASGCNSIQSSDSNKVPVLSQTPKPNKPVQKVILDAQWRVINRLTYGPSPDSLINIDAAASPQQWALDQLVAARQASLQPPHIPRDLQSINAPLPALFEGAKKEREARASVKPGMKITEQIANEKRFDFTDDNEPLFFNRRQLSKGVGWRLASCSSDEIEQAMLARMTEFWFNHFNIYQQKGPVRPFAGHFAIHVARAHALGKFEDLLMASAKHPAMLFYLDQWQSVSPQAARNVAAPNNNRGLNENYARELMELHTLGAQGGYTQADVRALAQILTGWTVAPRSDQGFQFVARLHDSSDKTWMGLSFAGEQGTAGEKEGEIAIRHLARHPATARRIAQRLAEYFVSDHPSAELVAQMAQTFTDTQGDIYQVMHKLLTSADFWDPQNKLYRTPFDYACGAMRTLQAGSDRSKWLQALGYTFNAGQPVQNWPTPDGYAFNAATWLSPEALTKRIDFALLMARNAPERSDLYPYMSESSLKVVMNQTPAQRMGFVLGSPEFIYK